MHCPKCKSKNDVKNVYAHGKSRKKCKDCGCNFTQSEPCGKLKDEAIVLYLEGLGFGV